MEEDCTDVLDLYLASEGTDMLMNSPWTVESVLSWNHNNMADKDDDQDIQDLFDGEIRNQEVAREDDIASSESSDEEPIPQDAKELTDEEITKLRVRELNKLLRNVPWDEAAKIRKRRRNLKNRGYALTCRLRKQQEHEDLFNENTSLKKQVEDGKWMMLKVWKEREAYKKKYMELQQSFLLFKQKMEAS